MTHSRPSLNSSSLPQGQGNGLYCVKNLELYTPSASGFYTRQAVRQNTGRFKNCKNSLCIAFAVFIEGMVLL